ncbi:MAG: MFS transporter, partial [Candidatus Bathyarchaeia archaeon]
ELLISLSAIGLLFASFGGVNALIRIPSGMVSDAVGRRRPLLLSYLLAIGAFLILSGTDRLPMLVAGMMLYGAAWGLRVPPSSALLGDVVEPRELPIAMAILWMAADLGYAVGAGLAGPIGTLIPFPTIVRSMTLVLGFCAALILLGLEDR